MSVLYDLTDKLTSLQRLAESGKADQKAIADTMEMVEGDFDDKAVGYVKVYVGAEAHRRTSADAGPHPAGRRPHQP